MSPQRIQRKRTKGWRMPGGAIYVGRPSLWGNPYTRGTRAENVANYRHWAANKLTIFPLFLGPLRGHDLVCWCPLDQPCHADVLLELANR